MYLRTYFTDNSGAVNTESVMSATEGTVRKILPLCLKTKCTDFLFKYLLDLPEITSDLLRSMTLGKLQSGSNVSSTDHSSTGNHFP